MINEIHPCFGGKSRHGRIHLPVAPRCNIQCGYCDRRYNCANESRPGVTAKVMSPAEACELAVEAARQLPWLVVAGIAGPGDPLANPVETLETFEHVRHALPNLLLCLSTNGLALPDYANELAELGVTHLTVTINAVTPEIGARIYQYVNEGKARLEGLEGAGLLLERQLEGISRVLKHGLIVKANMVIVPGINEHHAPEVAARLAKEGVTLMNCIPVSPVQGTALGNVEEPSPQLMGAVRDKAEAWLPQMRHCGRCRADAVGKIGGKSILAQFRKTPAAL